ncbi:MAG: hypothetical protein WAN79_10505 [Opitutaceae bacterium]
MPDPLAKAPETQAAPAEAARVPGRSHTLVSAVVALVRVQGLILLFYGMVNLTYFHSYWRNFEAPHPAADDRLAAELDLAGCLVRFVLYWGAGLFLITRAARLVAKLMDEADGRPHKP